MNLAAFDLNLLVAFDALLAERSVTRAAARVGVTQPAMSGALNRLRAVLDDPVLVRKPSGMMPTARARALADPIRRVLSDIASALTSAPTFNPAQAMRDVTVATMDHGAIVILPGLVAHLQQIAPGITLYVTGLGRFTGIPQGGQLETGEVDILLAPFPVLPPLQPGFHASVLLEDRFVSVVRAAHPQVGRQMTLKRFVALGHVRVDPMGKPESTVVDAALAARGHTRRVAVMVPDFWTAAQVVARTDLAATMTEAVAHALARVLPLRLLRPPLDLPPIAFSMVWHDRTHHEPTLVWLRAQIAEIAASRAGSASLRPRRLPRAVRAVTAATSRHSLPVSR